MNLKDAIQADIKRVFLNTDEFAEIHTLDGEPFTCIRKDNSYVQSGGERLGIYLQKTVIIIDQSDIANVPVEGQRLNVDGENLYVEGVELKSGVLNIILSANKAY